MGVSVTALRDKMRGGGARPSLFFTSITFPDYVAASILGMGGGTEGTAAQKEISFFMKAASIPESSLGSTTVPFLGRDFKIPSIDRTFAPFTVTVINDENYKIRHFFESWIEYVSPGAAIFESVSGFGEDATNQVYGQMEVHQLKKEGGIATSGVDGNQYMASYFFKDAFPTTVSEISLGWDQKDTIEEFAVTFEYQYWIKLPAGLPATVTNPFTGNDNNIPKPEVSPASSWVTKTTT